jgi:hypothetical protein
MLLSRDLYTGLIQYVQAEAGTTPVFIRGTPNPPVADVDEWLSFDILSIIDGPCRRNTIERYIDIQIICFSKYATLRSDNKFVAIYDLADKYSRLFHKKDVMIKNTCIQFKENKIVPLDLRSVGDFAKDILQQLPPLHTLSVVLLNQGVINSTQEI